jgi:hypothetical protein
VSGTRPPGRAAVPRLVPVAAETPEGGFEDGSRSPAERIGRAFTDWLQDRPRRDRRPRFEPVEVALFSVVAAVALLIVAGAFSALAYSSQRGFGVIDGVVTALGQWAVPSIALALLGACFLAWHHNRSSCDDIERFLSRAHTDGTGDARATDDLVSSGLGQVRRSRSALVCLAILGLLSAAAAVTILVWELWETVGHAPQLSSYAYASTVLETLAVVVPAVVAVAIAFRGWARATDVLERGGAAGRPASTDG